MRNLIAILALAIFAFSCTTMHNYNRQENQPNIKSCPKELPPQLKAKKEKSTI
jgi:hypothetical protein